MLTNWQSQIILGTVLGGSSLIKPGACKNYHLSMRGTNGEWIGYKAAELKPLFPDLAMTLEGKTFRCHSVSDPHLTELHGQLYDGTERRISEDVLAPLRDIGLAVWFLDSGSKTGRNNRNAYLSTTLFGQRGSEVIRDYFATIDCDSKICMANGGKRLRLIFTVDGSDQLLKIIAPNFPDFMHHRL